MSIVDDLAPLFDAEITVQPGTLNGFGAWTSSGAGAAYTLPCRYEGGQRMVRPQSGAQEVVSSLLCLIGGVLTSHDASLLRFTIPAEYVPNALLQALRIDPVRDETGIVSAEVYLP